MFLARVTLVILSRSRDARVRYGTWEGNAERSRCEESFFEGVGVGRERE